MTEDKIEEKPEKGKGHRAVKLTADMLPKDFEQPKSREPFEVETAESQPVPVRVIIENGPTALVEWTVGSAKAPDLKRAYVPKEVIQNLSSDRKSGAVEQAELDAGTPYGVRWEEFVVITATPEAVGYQFRRRNIWTLHDFEINVMAAQAAFMEAFGADLGAMLQAIHKQEE